MLGRIVLVLALLLAGLVPAGAQATLRSADLVRQFEEVAFPVRPDAKGAPGPRRFLRPPPSVTVSVMSDYRNPGPSRRLAALVKKLGPDLRETAGIPIEVKPGGQTPFFIDGVRARDFELAAHRLDDDPRQPVAEAIAQDLKAGGCFTYTYQHADGSIYAGRIVIDVSRPAEDWTPCVYRGVLHFLGLDGNASGPTGVFVPDLAGFRGLTPRDVAMIRMAYDPRLKPGMTLAEARPLLPAIAADAIGG